MVRLHLEVRVAEHPVIMLTWKVKPTDGDGTGFETQRGV